MLSLEGLKQCLNWKYIIVFSTGIVCLKILSKSKVKRIFYAYILDQLAKSLDKSKYYNKIRQDIFSPLKNLPTNGPKQKIVEIGAGSGANFKFYPDNAQIICIEPNDCFDKYAMSNCPQRLKNNFSFLVAKAENMEKIESNSIDAVVCTLVLCSVDDQKKAVKEVKRILKPGASFYFFEHVKGSGRIESLFQIILEQFWWFLSECRTRSDTKRIINDIGFSKTNIIDCRLPVPRFMVFLKPAIAGTATK